MVGVRGIARKEHAVVKYRGNGALGNQLVNVLPLLCHARDSRERLLRRDFNACVEFGVSAARRVLRLHRCLREAHKPLGKIHGISVRQHLAVYLYLGNGLKCHFVEIKILGGAVRDKGVPEQRRQHVALLVFRSDVCVFAFGDNVDIGRRDIRLFYGIFDGMAVIHHVMLAVQHIQTVVEQKRLAFALFHRIEKSVLDMQLALVIGNCQQIVREKITAGDNHFMRLCVKTFHAVGYVLACRHNHGYQLHGLFRDCDDKRLDPILLAHRCGKHNGRLNVYADGMRVVVPFVKALARVDQYVFCASVIDRVNAVDRIIAGQIYSPAKSGDRLKSLALTGLVVSVHVDEIRQSSLVHLRMVAGEIHAAEITEIAIVNASA